MGQLLACGHQPRSRRTKTTLDSEVGRGARTHARAGDREERILAQNQTADDGRSVLLRPAIRLRASLLAEIMSRVRTGRVQLITSSIFPPLCTRTKDVPRILAKKVARAGLTRGSFVLGCGASPKTST
jgi:hypothetical protein